MILRQSEAEELLEDGKRTLEQESPTAWAERLADRLRGLLKEELAAYGGGEDFLRWVRSEDPEPADPVRF